MCQWIINVLLDRPQVVEVNTLLSQPLILSTGAPQGCVFSPLLYSLFTNDCRSNSNSTLVFKFSDDTTIEGLITNTDETVYSSEVDQLVDWCGDNNLELNVSKTKEMVIDFRRKKTPTTPLLIKGQTVEMVDSFQFLGTTISKNLKWEDNNINRQESPTTSVLLSPTEEVWSQQEDPLSGSYWECADILDHCLVWQCQCSWQKTTWWHCQGCIKPHGLWTAITGVCLHHTYPAQSKMHHLRSTSSCSSPSPMSPLWEAFQDYQNKNFLLQKQFLPQSSPDYATSTLNYHTMIFWLTQCKLTIISSICACKTFYIVIGNLTST